MPPVAIMTMCSCWWRRKSRNAPPPPPAADASAPWYNWKFVQAATTTAINTMRWAYWPYANVNSATWQEMYMPLMDSGYGSYDLLMWDGGGGIPVTYPGFRVRFRIYWDWRRPGDLKGNGQDTTLYLDGTGALTTAPPSNTANAIPRGGLYINALSFEDALRKTVSEPPATAVYIGGIAIAFSQYAAGSDLYPRIQYRKHLEGRDAM